MVFELPTPQAATLTAVDPRTEFHGDEEVLAVSLGFKITTGNTLLDRLSPTLRQALYMAEPNQLTIPTVDPGTPRLRTDAIRSAALDFRFEGWTLAVLRRVDERVGVILPACKLDKFRLEPIEGGSITLTFHAGTSQVSPDLIGDLCGQLGHEVAITLTAPTPAPDEPKASDEDLAARKTLPAAKRQHAFDLEDKPPASPEELLARTIAQAKRPGGSGKIGKGH